VDDLLDGAPIAGIIVLGIDLIGVGETSPVDRSIALSPQTLVGYRFFEGCYAANAINVALTARTGLTALQIVVGGSRRRRGYRVDAGISAVDLTCYFGRRR
jgi:hypothetical protein